MNEKRARRELRNIYSKLPALHCRGKCQRSCGVILCSSAEKRGIERRRGAPVPGLRPDGRCPLLDEDGLCSVYARRPLICRLFGATKGLRCPWGCEPKRWMSEAKARRLIERAARVGGGHGLLADPDETKENLNL